MKEIELNSDSLEIYEKSASEKLNKKDLVDLWNLDLKNLLDISYSLKKLFNKEKIDLCSIMNAKSGVCSENCIFCSQSKHNSSKIDTYELKSKEEILKNAKSVEKYSNRFSIVVSGKSVTDLEFENIIESIEEIQNKTKLKVCVSLGLLNKDKLKALKEKNVRIHNNLETSENYFKNICTSHDYIDKIKVILEAKKMGLEMCSGGIFGMGESVADRVDLLLDLKKLDVDSVALNLLNPICGTRIYDKINSGEFIEINHTDALKSICIARIALPKKVIRLCGGREHVLKDMQKYSLYVLDGLMIGNYLTTNGQNIQSDLKMIDEMGFKQ
ncbi:biotin synthase BioB [Methanococcus maripaludis]|uniref:Biotin synthase n=2 Tax=Methanococcus maripaludis TaxID=39152 RepID=BIOB_METM7|nr:biotin synthase BioB [Methanococcus maripaludis]A6VGH7.1 RecName: Full=Biotin synthase [Methanococcus maripaludis C7]MBA2861204.1 biotin synthase [Methanococcus maripaludis]